MIKDEIIFTIAKRSFGWLTGAFLAVVVLIATGCDSKTETIVSGIPDAENLFFTPEGRLFVSGGKNVFEIIQKPDGSYDKLDMFHDACIVEGIAQRENYIVGVCSRDNFSELLHSDLIAARIEPLDQSQIDPEFPNRHPSMEMNVIHSLSSIIIPNGVAVDAYGDVYIADYAAPKIHKVTLTDSTQVEDVSVWKEGVGAIVNGLKWQGDQLYFTAQLSGLTTAALGRVQQHSDGSAGDHEILYERRFSVLDDLLLFDGGVLLTDYLKGSIFHWKDGEIVYETDQATFFAPTAIAEGVPPLFGLNTFLVTEKGIIGNSSERLGNKLGLFQVE